MFEFGFGCTGQWYTQTFSDQTMYWRASGVSQKNGNRSGILITVDTARPRAKPRAKVASVARTDERLWRRVDATAVPSAVLALFR